MTVFNRLISYIFISTSLAVAQSDMELGIKNYNDRSSGSIESKASETIISSAIHYFENAIKIKNNEREAGIFLLKCYYFKGKHVATNDNNRKSFYNLGKNL